METIAVGSDQGRVAVRFADVYAERAAGDGNGILTHVKMMQPVLTRYETHRAATYDTIRYNVSVIVLFTTVFGCVTDCNL